MLNCRAGLSVATGKQSCAETEHGPDAQTGVDPDIDQGEFADLSEDHARRLVA